MKKKNNQNQIRVKNCQEQIGNSMKSTEFVVDDDDDEDDAVRMLDCFLKF